jgi:nucleoside-diphosphate-sugar epimerase
LQVIVLRPFNMVGEINSPRQVLGAFVDKVLEQRRTGVLQPIRMGYLGAIRDFFCVEDLFLLILRLIEKPRAEFDIFNVCSGHGQSARDVIRYLTDRLGSIEVVEDEGPVAAKAGDRIVGNSARFLAAAGLEHPSPLKPVLDRIWPAAGL